MVHLKHPTGHFIVRAIGSSGCQCDIHSFIHSVSVVLGSGQMCKFQFLLPSPSFSLKSCSLYFHIRLQFLQSDYENTSAFQHKLLQINSCFVCCLIYTFLPKKKKDPHMCYFHQRINLDAPFSPVQAFSAHAFKLQELEHCSANLEGQICVLVRKEKIRQVCIKK